jgi:putative flippase GtrA
MLQEEQEERVLPLTEMEEKQTKEGSSTGAHVAISHRSDTWSSTIRQFLRYCLVGGVNTAIDLLVLNILLWRFPTNNVQVLVVYNSFAYSSGAVSSFFLNKYWTFRQKHRTTRREVMRFASILLLEVLYSNGLVWLAGKALQPVIANPTLWGNASKLIAVAVGAVISYIFMRFWTFASGSQNQAKQQETAHQATSESTTSLEFSETEHAHRAAENKRAR